MWSNSRAPASLDAVSFSSDESAGEDEDDGASGGEEEEAHSHHRRTPRPTYRNSVHLSRKWVRKSASSGRLLPPPQFTALATSPCGCMFTAACKGSDELIVWLRRRNLPEQGKPWNGNAGGGRGGRGASSSRNGVAAGGEEGEGLWNFQPTTVLAHGGQVAQVVWGRGAGTQQDYLLSLGADGRCV